MSETKKKCCCFEESEKKLSSKNDKADLIKRLKRIEGQVKGIQKMIDDERYCMDVLIQISAAKAAMNRVGNIILENHIKGCVSESIRNDSDEESDKVIGELMDNIYKFMK